MKKLIKTIRSFSKLKVLVIGDLILDEYIWGDVDRISPEAPVPVVWARKRSFVPGGAANVASNLRSFNAKTCLAGVVGTDLNRAIMLKELSSRGIDTRAVVSETGRHTTLKSRVFSRHQQLIRIDWEHVNAITKKTQERILAYVGRTIRQFDAVIIEDYGKGMFSNGFLTEVIGCARRAGRIVTVDPKEDNFESYLGVDAITPNRKEMQNAIRYLKMKDADNRFKIYKDTMDSDAEIRSAGYAILRHLDLKSLLITLGEQGMWLFEQRTDRHISTVAQEVFDVSGAGDTVISVFTLGLCAGASPSEAAHIANFAAGIVVGKLGTATTTQAELIERLKKFHAH